MYSQMELTVISKDKNEIKLILLGNTTLKQMKMKLASKMDISPEDFGIKYFLTYNDKKLDLNSDEEICDIFNITDNIYMVGSDKETIVNAMLRKKIIERERKNRNLTKNKNIIIETLEGMAALGSVDNLVIEKEKKENPENFISIDECINSNNDQFFILGILAKYLEKIGISTVIEKKDETQNEEKVDFGITLLQFICNGYILKNKYILDFKLSQKRLEQLYNTEKNDEVEKFNRNLKKVLSKEYKLKEEEIIITYFKKDPNLFSSIVVFNSNFDKNLTKDELLRVFKKQLELKYLTNVKKCKIFESIRLNLSILDSRGNNKSDGNWGFDEIRGGEPYNPPVGWHRYGLRVMEQYDKKKNDWLSYDNRDGEWCIAYSELSGMVEKNEDGYQNATNARKKEEKVGNGVCVSPDPKIIENKTEIVDFNGVKYKMGLMVRIKPDVFRVPETNKNIWVVNGTPNEIRPYGILLKIIK